MNSIRVPIINEYFVKKGFYKDIKNFYNLKDIRDIVWMKFTRDGFLGVVATSNDINFHIPKNLSE